MEQISHISAVDNSYSTNNKESWLSALAYMFMAYWREAEQMGVIYYHE